jgi:hypothetical protein
MNVTAFIQIQPKLQEEEPGPAPHCFLGSEDQPQHVNSSIMNLNIFAIRAVLEVLLFCAPVPQLFWREE